MWPPLEKVLHHNLTQPFVLLHKLHYAVAELGVVRRHVGGLVKWKKGTNEELSVFLLEWECEPIDDTTQNLQKLADTRVPRVLSEKEKFQY